MEDDGPRNLTDADAKTVARLMLVVLREDLSSEVGTGILALVKKALFYIVLALAVYGLMQTQGFFANIHFGTGQ
jgi:hypothetical protein